MTAPSWLQTDHLCSIIAGPMPTSPWTVQPNTLHSLNLGDLHPYRPPQCPSPLFTLCTSPPAVLTFSSSLLLTGRFPILPLWPLVRLLLRTRLPDALPSRKDEDLQQARTERQDVDPPDPRHGRDPRRGQQEHGLPTSRDGHHCWICAWVLHWMVLLQAV